MTKAKTNALDALRSLIAERQQYEQWITSLDERREGTPEHVFERVKADYQSRLERVIRDIGGHAEELQLSISTLSSRLVEVAREEDTRREGLQEAELRAAVGEYEPAQWDQLRADSEQALEKIAADRVSLDSQLGELRGIQKLSEAGSTGSAAAAEPAPLPDADTLPAADAQTPSQAPPRATPQTAAAPETPAEPPLAPQQSPVAQASAQAEPRSAAQASAAPSSLTEAQGDIPPTPRHVQDRAPGGREMPPQALAEPAARRSDQARLPLDPAAASKNTSAADSAGRGNRTPPGGVSAGRPKPEAARPDSAKTLKCPECGTPNHATEWYCERCGGELATM